MFATLLPQFTDAQLGLFAWIAPVVAVACLVLLGGWLNRDRGDR